MDALELPSSRERPAGTGRRVVRGGRRCVIAPQLLCSLGGGWLVDLLKKFWQVWVNPALWSGCRRGPGSVVLPGSARASLVSTRHSPAHPRSVVLPS